MSDIVLLLLGYPIAIIANFSTEFIKDYFQNQDETPLKALFIKSFYKSLDNNIKGVDSIGSKAIKTCKEVIKKDEERLFRLISRSIMDVDISLENIRDDSIKEKISEELIKEFNLIHLNLAKNVIYDCFSKYEVAFFASMSTKDGLVYIIKYLNKLNSKIATKNDIEALKQFIVSELQNIQVDNNIKNIADFINEETINPESELFSDSIVSNMLALKKTIEKLTKDQFQIIHYLKYKKRVVISGCAGSGKTLLAAEKAIRLDNAGVRTMILTHNPNLANHIKNLVASQTIEVFDFTNLINSLLNKKHIKINDWNEYIEPLDEELSQAFDIIIDKKISYEAIIVDEGQDFRELWWLLIEALSNNSANKILYIFHDDSQLLLPFPTKYPLEESPFLMSKNCRNAGVIFDIVRKFHFNAPLTSEFLKGKGILKMNVFSSNMFESAVEDAIIEVGKTSLLEHLSIITNEPSSDQSILNGMEIIYSDKTNWRTTVLSDLEKFRNKALKRIENLQSSSSISEIYNRFRIPLDADIDLYLQLPNINANRIPTEEDVKSVCDYAKILSPFFEGKRIQDGFFMKEGGELSIKVRSHTGKILTSNSSSKIEFYMSSQWADKLLKSEIIKITSLADLNNQNNKKTIKINTIDMFKGLESDAIILFINDMNKDIYRELYIGTSRAIGYLHILTNRSVYEKIIQLKDTKLTLN